MTEPKWKQDVDNQWYVDLSLGTYSAHIYVDPIGGESYMDVHANGETTPIYEQTFRTEEVDGALEAAWQLCVPLIAKAVLRNIGFTATMVGALDGAKMPKVDAKAWAKYAPVAKQQLAELLAVCKEEAGLEG